MQCENFAVLPRYLHVCKQRFTFAFEISSLAERETLCCELRTQFKGRHSDLDLRELIHNRKQMVAEKFYAYYDAILQLADRNQSSYTWQRICWNSGKEIKSRNPQRANSFRNHNYTSCERICGGTWTIRGKIAINSQNTIFVVFQKLSNAVNNVLELFANLWWLRSLPSEQAYILYIVVELRISQIN